MATANFLTAAGNLNGRRLIATAHFILNAVAGGTKTLLVASSEILLPAGTSGGTTFTASLWQKGLLEDVVIHAPGGFATTSLSPATADFSLENRDYALTDGTVKNLKQLLADHYWQGSTVTIRLWEQSLTSMDDAFCAFLNGIILGITPGMDSVAFSCRQRNDWNRPVCPQSASKERFRNIPESNAGAPIPTIIGSKKAQKLLVPPYPSEYDDISVFRDAAHGVRGVAKALLVDMGRGLSGTKARVMVAWHPVKSLGVVDLPAFSAPLSPYGVAPAIDVGSGGGLGWFGAQASSDVFNDSTNGAGWTIPDDFPYTTVPVFPTDINPLANTGSMPRTILDPYSMAYCHLDQTNYRVEARLPSLSDDGDIEGASMVVVYRTSSGATGLKLRFGDGGGYTEAACAASTTITYQTTSIGTAWGTAHLPSTPFGFSDHFLRAEFSSGSGSADIYWMGIFVWIKLRRKVISKSDVRGPDILVPESEWQKVKTKFPRPPHAPRYIPGPVTTQVVSEQEGTFYANVEGWPDNGSGDYTGVANALVTRPCDIGQLLIAEIGLEALSKIERGTSVHGSFVDARAKMKTWRQGDMALALTLARQDGLQPVLESVARDSVSWIFLSHLDDKWKFVPWDTAAAVNYGRLLDRYEANGAEVDFTPLSDVVTSIKLSYGYDEFKRSCLHETNAGADHSLSGYAYGNQRDQAFVVTTGVSDTIDWYDGTTERHATIAAGNYSAADAMSAVSSALVTSLNSVKWGVGYGGLVVAGLNDKITIGGSVMTLTPGNFSMEQRAAEVQAWMIANLGGVNFCSYSRTTQKFTFTRIAGFTISAASGQDGAHALFGLHSGSHTGNPIVSDTAVEEERFVIGTDQATFALRWRTGTNGWANTTPANIKTAAEVLGFAPYDDSTAARVYGGVCPKGEREAALSLARDKRGGERPQLEINSQAINDTETAREVRNRIVDLMRKPRVRISLASQRALDVERGQVIGLADIDATLGGYPDPGSDGSWSGKRFVVTETELQYGPTACYNRLVAVGLD